MLYGQGHLDSVDLAIQSPGPGSPPGMSSSKSSKASSLRSFNSDEDDCTTADVGHFEEIGLDDDPHPFNTGHRFENIKATPNPYSATFAADVRAKSAKHVGPQIYPRGRDLARLQSQRDITSLTKNRPASASLATQFRDTSTQNLTMGLGPEPHTSPLPMRGLSPRSASSAGATGRRRSPSPIHLPRNPSSRSASPQHFHSMALPRRSSSRASVDSRLTVAAEREYEDNEDDDDIPDGLILDNVPLSPRPPTERSISRPPSASTSPERQTKITKVRSVGNGTPAVAADQGSLKSPSWRSEHSVDSSNSALPSPKGRAKSWNAAISELNAEAKALTEKLEEHADELQRHGGIARAGPKPRVKSALAELPPLRRTNIMIDPLPISKEKEAALSRTRPSWLPPKDPAEEKKHLKEYKKMMASSIEAEKKREAARREKEQSKDKIANDLIRVWEEDVLGRWERAVRERRTRELWWKGIAPRCRGAVWSRAIGNELGLSETSFEAALARSQAIEKRAQSGSATSEDEKRMAWFTRIRADVEERTWVDLKIFQTGAPLHQKLIDVLCAYAMYRSDIGYVTGCHTIAALLLLNLDTPAAAFIALANVLNRSLPLSFFASDLGAQASAYNLVQQGLERYSTNLHHHFRNKDLDLDVDVLLGDIFRGLFTQHLGLDECTRLWDVYVFEGDAVMIRAAVGLMLGREVNILGAKMAKEVKEAIQVRPGVPSGHEEEFMARVRAVKI
ncbi:hypothetical protein F5Y15DRAFT_419415 [Xylariaceae sp. FL0016]|nr:hypothetical protein F5Y15DRAFT_419415 [Xylariaceae sp. FL0016]